MSHTEYTVAISVTLEKKGKKKKKSMFLNCVSLENNLKDYGIFPTHTLAEYPFKTIETL